MEKIERREKEKGKAEASSSAITRTTTRGRNNFNLLSHGNWYPRCARCSRHQVIETRFFLGRREGGGGGGGIYPSVVINWPGSGYACYCSISRSVGNYAWLKYAAAIPILPRTSSFDPFLPREREREREREYLSARKRSA